jgi:glutamyl/glutaminyl-tRNA synthetase
MLEHIPADLLEKALAIVNAHQAFIAQPDEYMARIKKDAQATQVPTKIVFLLTRMLLTGSAHGHSLIDIISLLGHETVQQRINQVGFLLKS